MPPPPGAGEGRRRVLGTAPDPSLCVTDAFPRISFGAVLREGDTLVLHTDGLVETPDTDIGDNLRLRAVVSLSASSSGVPVSNSASFGMLPRAIDSGVSPRSGLRGRRPRGSRPR
ncbi:SpoIIE family protein phosphatase [Streptomyces sp. CFMR 7]|uniref:SpoIIE family protein phosphatase n=1 Tax=Streptomyces sp. CFMR 7 TaxID=1649184 RepID=UPI000B848C58